MGHVNQLLDGCFLFRQIYRKVFLHFNIFPEQDHLRQFCFENCPGVFFQFLGSLSLSSVHDWRLMKLIDLYYKRPITHGACPEMVEGFATEDRRTLRALTGHKNIKIPVRSEASDGLFNPVECAAFIPSGVKRLTCPPSGAKRPIEL